MGGEVSVDPSGSFGPVVVRRRLGAALRRLREHANLRLDQVASELEVSQSKISRLETGHAVAKTWDVRNLLTVYGVDDRQQREQLLQWVEESKAVAWWHPYSDASPNDLDYFMSLEAEAASVSQYCTPVVPGLLQTPDYARAALTEQLSDVEDLTKEEIDGLVEIRLRRREALTRPENPLHLDLVLDESALLRRVGDQQTMQEQLRSLFDLGENVEFRVRPLAAPPRRYALSPFTIFFPRLSSIDLTIVNIEAAGRDYYLEEPPDAMQFQSAFKKLWSDSLNQTESIELIRNLVS